MHHGADDQQTDFQNGNTYECHGYGVLCYTEMVEDGEKTERMNHTEGERDVKTKTCTSLPLVDTHTHTHTHSLAHTQTHTHTRTHTHTLEIGRASCRERV